MLKIKVFELVGKNAISMQSGTKLYNEISSTLSSGKEVELNFDEVALYASPFFNASIGLMLKDISIDELKKCMKIVDINEIGRDLLNNVIQNAIVFYKNENNISDVLDSSEK